MLDDEYFESSSIKQWAQNIIEICYIVEDIIDDVQNTRIKNRNRSVTDVSSGGGSSSSLYSRAKAPVSRLFERSSSPSLPKFIKSAMKKWKLSNRISDLTEEVLEIKKKLNDACKKGNNRPPPRDNSSASVEDAPLPSGRKLDKEEIIRKLLRMSNDDKKCGISIVGMNGLGKTILAHSILEDNRIKSHFNDIRMASAPNSWRSIDDQDYSIKTIASASVNGDTSQPSTSVNGDTSQPSASVNGDTSQPSSSRIESWRSIDDQSLSITPNGDTSQPSSLGGGRECTSLLVLDNLGDINVMEWLSLRKNLVGTEFPALIITSCYSGVSKITGTELCHLKTLSDNDCEEIIMETVSPILDQDGRSVLKSKIKNIAQKSSGLPLAAHAIGLSLRSDCNRPEYSDDTIKGYEKEDCWNRIYYDLIHPRLGFNQSIFSELIKFLAYFALFPPTHDFKEHELSQLWRAEGLTTNNAAEWTSSTPADNPFHSLVSRSILRSEEPSPIERAASATYRIHAFTHKYAETVACSTHFRLDQADQGLRNTPFYHFSACCELKEKQLKGITKNNGRLRTLLLHRNYRTEINTALQSLFVQLAYLRVLSLSGSDIESLPGSIKNLKLLRYLDMSSTPVNRLSEAVCDLLGLQVLKLNPCNKLRHLPENIGNLINLLHLDLNVKKLISAPVNLGKLTNLQTLPLFLVRCPRQCVSELKNMNSLEGSIKIAKLENASNKQEAMKADLKSKAKITKLELEWAEDSREESSKAIEIMDGLEPNHNLTELKISHYSGRVFSTWVSALKDLASIYLFKCPECRDLPPFGKLPLLRNLKLEKLCMIVTVNRSLSEGQEHRDYPALKRLEILKMKELTIWEPILADEMPKLNELVVEDCPNLVSLPMISRPSLIGGPKIANCPNIWNNPKATKALVI